MITVEWKGVERALRDLKLFAGRAVPHAARNALNSSAFAAQREWRDEIKRTFTTRNSYTERSIRVEKAYGFNTGRMVAIVGSIADYMETQEKGGIERGKSGKKAIPAPTAAGQPSGGKRTRLVRAPARLGVIHAVKAKRGFASSPRQRNMIAVQIALRKGQRHVLLTRKGGGKGLYRITGGKRRFKTRLLYDVSKQSVRIPANPTLQRTLKTIEGKLPRILHDSLVYQLKRHRVFGY